MRMPKYCCTLLLILTLLPAGAFGAAQEPPKAPGEAAAADLPTGNKELAVRFATLAQQTLRQKVVLPPHFRQAAALLMAAKDLDPQEPRYPRMLYEAMIQMRDYKGALEAIKAYRAVDAHTVADQGAMVQFIDLNMRFMETAEERSAFLQGLLNSQAPEEVRSHVAFRAAQIARERGQADLEESLMGQALRLNPLNLDALRVRLDQQSVNGTALERVNTMLQMIRSNPVQPLVTYRLARELAEAGLVEESLRLYTLTVKLATDTGTAMGRDFAMGYASELYIMSQPQLLAIVRPISDQLIKADPTDVEALLLRWLAERAGDDKETLAKLPAIIINASLNRVLTVRQQLGVAGAATRPSDAEDATRIPDLSEDVKRLQEDKYRDFLEPYAQAVADLAWYLVYVANRPADAAGLLPVLKALIGDNNPVPVRIEGWIFLSQNKLNEAKMRLQAVAEQDVLARMGTLILAAKEPAQKEKAAADARALMIENPTGLLGAVLLDGVRPLGAKVEGRSDGTALQQSVAAFPRDWLRIVDNPQAFYRLRAEMNDGRVRFPFGEPMMAKVTITNIAQMPLTIGPEGVIKSDLWFDAQFRGLVQQNIVGAAYDRIGQVLVLRPGQSITQTIRLDQGQLTTALEANPQPTLTFYGQVRTNPRGEGGSYPCGYNVNFSTITEREGFGITDQGLRTLTNQVAAGTPAEKIRGLELVAALVSQLRPQAAENEQAKTLVNGFSEAINKSVNDPVHGVATWGAFLVAVQVPAREPQVRQAFLKESDPTRRLLGLLMSNAVAPDEQKALLTKVLAQEKHEMVRTYASAMLEIAEVALAQKASTPENPGGGGGGAGPTTAPTTAPVLPPTPQP